MLDAPLRFKAQDAAQRTTRGRRDRALVASAALLLTATTLAAGPRAGEPPSAGPGPTGRFLVIVLDAVPFDTAVELTGRLAERRVDDDGGAAAVWGGPVPLVSSFPSSTSVALTAILSRFGLALPPGYEKRCFAREDREVRGGSLGSYGKIRFDWHHFFDWQLRGFLRKSKAYARPLRYNVLEIDRALAAFEASERDAFFVYVNSTDATGHSHGPEAMDRAFDHLFERLEALRARLREPLHVVLLSDHGLGGGPKLRNAFPNVARALKRAGWQRRKRLKTPDSVVLTPFGLVSSFEAYTGEGDEADVTEVIVGAEGVDLCAYRDGSSWIVADRDGRAVIESRPLGDARAWSYTPRDGDPLELAGVVAELGGSDRARFFDEGRWFDATLDTRYPDPLYRIATGFELVQNPASILCSVADGYLYGSKSASFAARFSVGRLEWTHGALTRDATLGFLMTDVPGWAPDGAVRFDEALDFLADRLITEHPSSEESTP